MFYRTSSPSGPLPKKENLTELECLDTTRLYCEIISPQQEPLPRKRKSKPSAKLLEAREAEKAKEIPSPRKREPGKPMIGKKRKRDENEDGGEKTIADIGQ